MADAVTPAPTASAENLALPEWLAAAGAPQPHAELIKAELPGENRLLRAIAAHDIPEGATILSVPEVCGSAHPLGYLWSQHAYVTTLPQSCMITLAHVFEDEAVTELLTTGKLSELACLTVRQGRSAGG